MTSGSVPPAGAGYSVLLLLHVAAAVVGFGAVAVTGVQAARLRRGSNDPGAPGLRRYFRPGTNWAARALYAVPVLGFGLIADSGGAWDATDGWVMAGLGLWLAGAVLAEVVLWPAERRIQRRVAHHWDDRAEAEPLARDCGRAAVASALLLAVFLAALVVMTAKP
ncbi:MAG: DUF2269 family protein [Acidobacteriota bacterium]|nr:DUF2269 family protein [Acidobacteriota bacterium]